VKRGFGLALGLMSLAIGFGASALVTFALSVYAPQIFTGFQPVSAASQDSLAGEAVCFLVLGLIFSLIAGRALWKFMGTDSPAKTKPGGWWPGQKN
jgi:hypothetical protein